MNSRKSYLKIILPIAGLSAASIAVFTFPSCDSPNGKSLAEPQDTPAGLYREYLSEIRKSQELSFEELTVCIGEWQTLKDSVAAAFGRTRHSFLHGPSGPFRHTGRMSSVTRLHLLGTFPVGPVETAHLQGSVELKRAVLSLCRRRGTTPFRRGDPPVFRSAG